jgi:hypothetical protein
LGLASLWLLVSAQREDRVEALARHASKLSESGPEAAAPAGRGKPAEVKVGVYIDRIYDFSIVESSWKAEFFVWFTWTDPKLDPGETFHVVNGEILTKTLMVRKRKGASRYAMYKVTAQTTKGFNISRFPRDDHLLTLSIEDSAGRSDRLLYVDDDRSSVSSRAFVPGYAIKGDSLVVKPHLYRTSRGDPDLPPDFKATYSQATYAISISRPGWGLHFKMFVVMYAAVLIALLGFFIRSSCDRLALMSGSLFTDTGGASLADQLNWVGVCAIVLAIVQAVIYQHRYEGVEERARANRLFDLGSFWLLLALYALINLAVPLAASI